MHNQQPQAQVHLPGGLTHPNVPHIHIKQHAHTTYNMKGPYISLMAT